MTIIEQEHHYCINSNLRYFLLAYMLDDEPTGKYIGSPYASEEYNNSIKLCNMTKEKVMEIFNEAIEFYKNQFNEINNR